MGTEPVEGRVRRGEDDGINDDVIDDDLDDDGIDALKSPAAPRSYPSE
jgi:hypothetical protein